MMDTSKIESILPGSELGEIRPCTTAGRVQFHLLVSREKNPTSKIVDISKLVEVLKGDDRFHGLKSSTDLGVVKADYGSADVSILAGGRVVVKKCADEKEVQRILEALAPLLKQSFF